MTILGLIESFKTMNRSDLFRPDPTVTLYDGLFVGNFYTTFKSSIYAIEIWDLW